MKKFSFFCLSFLLVGSLSLNAKTVNKKFHESYDINKGAHLTLKHGDGNVFINSWNKDKIDIVVIYHAKFSGIGLKSMDFEVEFEKRGENITVEGHEPQGEFSIINRKIYEYSYTIQAPSYVELDINGVDGNVSIQDWENNTNVYTVDGNIKIDKISAQEVKLESVDGNISCRDIFADLSAQTVDGNIRVNGLECNTSNFHSVDGNLEITEAAGQFNLKTVDGNIHLEDADAKQLDVQASDGNVELDLNKVDELMAKIKTGDGSVTITIDRESSLDLDFRTGDGRIKLDVSPVSDIEQDEDYFRGSINGGEGQLTIRTGDGNISLTER